MRAGAKGSVWARRLACLAWQTVVLCGRFPGTRLGALCQARRLGRGDGCTHAWHEFVMRKGERVQLPSLERTSQEVRDVFYSITSPPLSALSLPSNMLPHQTHTMPRKSLDLTPSAGHHESLGQLEQNQSCIKVSILKATASLIMIYTSFYPYDPIRSDLWSWLGGGSLWRRPRPHTNWMEVII